MRAASLLRRRPVLLRLRLLPGVDLAERALVLAREHLEELRAAAIPVVEDGARLLAAGQPEVLLDQSLQDDLVALAAMPGGGIGLHQLLGRRQHLLEP